VKKKSSKIFDINVFTKICMYVYIFNFDLGVAAQQFPHLGARLSSMYSFLSSRWSWTMPCELHSEMSSSPADASQPNESVLSAKGIYTTHYHPSQTSFVARLVASRQYMPCRQRRHCTVKTHNRFHDIKRALFYSTTGDEFPPV